MSENQINARAEVTILVCALTFGQGFHFCSLKKLQGEDCDLWFPLANRAQLFEAVQSVMQINGIAHNVVSLEVIREFEGCLDVKVRYNRAK